MWGATATIKRRPWVSVDDPLMLQDHDRQWGVPAHDDHKHFEFLLLEGAQAGVELGDYTEEAGGGFRAVTGVARSGGYAWLRMLHATTAVDSTDAQRDRAVSALISLCKQYDLHHHGCDNFGNKSSWNL